MIRTFKPQFFRRSYLEARSRAELEGLLEKIIARLRRAPLNVVKSEAKWARQCAFATQRWVIHTRGGVWYMVKMLYLSHAGDDLSAALTVAQELMRAGMEILLDREPLRIGDSVLVC